MHPRRRRLRPLRRHDRRRRGAGTRLVPDEGRAGSRARAMGRQSGPDDVRTRPAGAHHRDPRAGSRPAAGCGRVRVAPQLDPVVAASRRCARPGLPGAAGVDPPAGPGDRDGPAGAADGDGCGVPQRGHDSRLPGRAAGGRAAAAVPRGGRYRARHRHGGGPQAASGATGAGADRAGLAAEDAEPRRAGAHDPAVHPECSAEPTPPRRNPTGDGDGCARGDRRQPSIGRRRRAIGDTRRIRAVRRGHGHGRAGDTPRHTRTDHRHDGAVGADDIERDTRCGGHRLDLDPQPGRHRWALRRPLRRRPGRALGRGSRPRHRFRPTRRRPGRPLVPGSRPRHRFRRPRRRCRRPTRGRRSRFRRSRRDGPATARPRRYVPSSASRRPGPRQRPSTWRPPFPPRAVPPSSNGRHHPRCRRCP